MLNAIVSRNAMHLRDDRQYKVPAGHPFSGLNSDHVDTENETWPTAA